MITQSFHNEVYQRLLTSLKAHWPRIAEGISIFFSSPSFHRFETTGDIDSKVTQGIASEIVACLGEILLDAKIQEQPAHQISAILRDFERAFNLAFFYLLQEYKHDVSAFVDICDLEDAGDLLFDAGGVSYFASFTSSGVRFGTADDIHRAEAFPLSNSLALKEFTPPEEKDLINTEIFRTFEKRLFARIRTVQRELFRLVSVWELRNTRLAFEQGQLRNAVKQGHATDSEYQGLLQRIGADRDHLALWCIDAFTEIQNWLSEFRLERRLSEDTKAELAAADRLLLSGLQKIFLPASVSRHKYNLEIAEALANWAAARLKFHKEDVATQLTSCCLLLACKKNVPLPEMPFLSQKSHEWSYAFDATTALKAFSWAYNEECNALLAKLVLVATGKKLYPEPLDAYWLSSIATLLQMQETFTPATPLPRGSVTMSQSFREELKKQVQSLLAKVTDDEESKNIAHYIQSYLAEVLP